MVHTVLIVDDNVTIRRLLSEAFNREADFKICGEAENGEQAIQKAQELHPDVIILDSSLPAMSGFEVARKLSEIMPATPLIFFSLYVDGVAEEELQSVGISAIVSKTENIGVLIEKARNLVNRTAA